MRIHGLAIASLLIVVAACTSEEPGVSEVGELAADECPQMGLAEAERLLIQERVSDWPPSHREYDVDAELDDPADLAVILDELGEAGCVAVDGPLADMPEPDHLVLLGEGDNVVATFGYYREPVRWGEDDIESRWLALGGNPAPVASIVELPEETLG